MQINATCALSKKHTACSVAYDGAPALRRRHFFSAAQSAPARKDMLKGLVQCDGIGQREDKPPEFHRIVAKPGPQEESFKMLPFCYHGSPNSP